MRCFMRGLLERLWLAVGEFSAHNRPVITSSVHDDDGTANFHIETLRAERKGLFYHDRASCVKVLTEFDRVKAQAKDWNAYREFEPSKVMAVFERVFVRGKGQEGAARMEGWGPRRREWRRRWRDDVSQGE